MKKEYLLTRTGTELTLAEGKTKRQHSTPLQSIHIYNKSVSRKKNSRQSLFVSNRSFFTQVSHHHITVPLNSVCFKLILSHQNNFIENSIITKVILQRQMMGNILSYSQQPQPIYRDFVHSLLQLNMQEHNTT